MPPRVPLQRWIPGGGALAGGAQPGHDLPGRSAALAAGGAGGTDVRRAGEHRGSTGGWRSARGAGLRGGEGWGMVVGGGELCLVDVSGWSWLVIVNNGG